MLITEAHVKSAYKYLVKLYKNLGVNITLVNKWTIELITYDGLTDTRCLRTYKFNPHSWDVQWAVYKHYYNDEPHAAGSFNLGNYADNHKNVTTVRQLTLWWSDVNAPVRDSF